MRYFAIVEPEGRVAQVENEDRIFPIAAPFEWVECPDWVRPDDKFFDGEFVKEGAKNEA